jgi:DNA recombination protein RmuC
MEPLFIVAAGLAALGLGWWLGRQAGRSESMGASQGLQQARQELDGLRQETGALRERAARAEQSAEEAGKRLQEDQARLGQLKAELGAEAAKLMKEQSGELRAEAGRHFDSVVAPLKQNLDDLKNLASRMHTEDQASRSGLAEQVRALSESHKTFALRADELSRNLRGNAQGQGKWGEMVLERVLELSGLRKGQEYLPQGEGLGLKAADGSAQKPDMVILLPDGKHILIDAKAPLDGYFAAVQAPEEATRLGAAQALVKALRKQVADLAARGYHFNEKLVTPEFTLLFVPIEAALAAALQQDPGLMEEAWEKRVVLVGPNMLFGTLKVVGQIWAQERRSRNAEDIAKRGGAMYDKLVGFVDDLSQARKAMKLALEKQEDAAKKLVDGRGNLINQAEDMRRLGAKVSKELPPKLLEAAQHSGDFEDDPGAGARVGELAP